MSISVRKLSLLQVVAFSVATTMAVQPALAKNHASAGATKTKERRGLFKRRGRDKRTAKPRGKVFSRAMAKQMGRNAIARLGLDGMTPKQARALLRKLSPKHYGGTRKMARRAAKMSTDVLVALFRIGSSQHVGVDKAHSLRRSGRILFETTLLLGVSMLAWESQKFFELSHAITDPLTNLSMIVQNGLSPENIKAMIKAIYFGWTTNTTIGYGDVSPGVWQTQIAYIILSARGLFAFSSLAGDLIEFSSHRRELKQNGEYRDWYKGKTSRTKDPFIVLGGPKSEAQATTFAGQIIDGLRESKTISKRSPVFLVTDRFSGKLPEDLQHKNRNAALMKSNPGDATALSAAGVKRARGVVALSESASDDASNLAAIRYIRDGKAGLGMKNVKIVAEVHDKENISLFKKQGVTIVDKVRHTPVFATEFGRAPGWANYFSSLLRPDGNRIERVRVNVDGMSWQDVQTKLAHLGAPVGFSNKDGRIGRPRRHDQVMKGVTELYLAVPKSGSTLSGKVVAEALGSKHAKARQPRTIPREAPVVLVNIPKSTSKSRHTGIDYLRGVLANLDVTAHGERPITIIDKSLSDPTIKAEVQKVIDELGETNITLFAGDPTKIKTLEQAKVKDAAIVTVISRDVGKASRSDNINRMIVEKIDALGATHKGRRILAEASGRTSGKDDAGRALVAAGASEVLEPFRARPALSISINHPGAQEVIDSFFASNRGFAAQAPVPRRLKGATWREIVHSMGKAGTALQYVDSNGRLHSAPTGSAADKPIKDIESVQLLTHRPHEKRSRIKAR